MTTFAEQMALDMAAILGDPSRPIEEICGEATTEAGEVVPANYNSPGQLVISGRKLARRTVRIDRT